MSDDSGVMMPSAQKTTLGDRIRDIANQLRQEDEVQVKATSRILAAAAQMAQNHDQLIHEVVEMVEDDLYQHAQSSQPSYTSEQLQRQFKSLKEAKAHFGVKASSWASLVTKLNEAATPPKPPVQDQVMQRLEAIERDVQIIREDVTQVLNILKLALRNFTGGEK